jgi:hypothetical protein
MFYPHRRHRRITGTELYDYYGFICWPPSHNGSSGDFPWQKFLTKTDFWSVGHDKKWLIVYPEVLCNPLIFRP